jgi:hypothetical protein
MNDLVKYLVEGILIEEKEEIIVLYPGGFKPPHGGHYELAKRYADAPNVQHVIVLVGPGSRDNITQQQSIQVWKELTKNDPKILIQTTDQNSPLAAAYKFVEKAKPGTYTLAASKKGDDYARVQKFIQDHGKTGKYKRSGINIIELPINVEPVTYENRSDEAQEYVPGKSENKKGISATILRVDLQKKDKEAFTTNYPNVADKNVIDKIYGILKKKEISEQKTLMEGGAAGHLAHPYEDLTLTFDDIKNLIDLSLSGKVEQAQEKLDGQNSLTLNQVKNTFADRGPLEAAFSEAVNDLSNAINKLTRDQKIKFFNNGEKFLNLEVLYPATQNIIPYEATQLRFHNIKTYDNAGNVVSEDAEGAERLEGALRQIQAQKQKTYQIKASNPALINKSKDYEAQKSELSKLADNISRNYNLTNKSTISDYITAWWKKYITQKAKSFNYNIPEEVLNLLIQRWGFTNKEMSIGNVRRLIDNGEFSSWVDSFDKTDLQSTKKACIKPLETLFLKLGVYVLQNVENLVAINPDAAVRSIKKDLRSAIEQIKQAAQTPSSEDDAVGLKVLKRELTRLKDIGGFSAILPTEGIVFKYNGKLFKLTGAFPAVNTIIGYLRY